MASLSLRDSLLCITSFFFFTFENKKIVRLENLRPATPNYWIKGDFLSGLSRMS